MMLFPPSLQCLRQILRATRVQYWRSIDGGDCCRDFLVTIFTWTRALSYDRVQRIFDETMTLLEVSASV